MGKSAGRNRTRRPARGASNINSRPRILCVTDGETERDYFTAFRTHCKNPRVEIDFVAAAGVPRTLVERARDEKKSANLRAREERDANLSYDEVWCIFDIDSHPKVKDAIKMALDNGLRVAVSNECFELWLLLHFR